jgi:hypothetical protein
MYVGHCSAAWLYVTLIHLSRVRFNRSPSFSSTVFQNFPDISDLLSETSKFRQNTKQWYKCSTALDGDLVFPLSNSSTTSFPQYHPVADYVLFLVFKSLTSLCLSSRVLEGTFYAKCDQPSYPSFFLLYVGHSSTPLLYVTLHFSRGQSNLSPSLSSTTFQTFPGISDLFFETSKCHHNTKQCSICSTVLTLSLLMSYIQYIYIYIYIYISYRTANLQKLYFIYLVNTYTCWIF